MAEKINSTHKTNRTSEYLTTLHKTAFVLMRQLDINILFEDIIRQAAKLVGTTEGYLFLYDASSNDLVIRVGIGRFENHIGFLFSPRNLPRLLALILD